MPNLIILFNFVNFLASLLHNSKIVLVSPPQEIHKFVVSTDFHESLENFGLASIPDMVALFSPFKEVGEQPLAQHCSYCKSSSLLVLGEECLFTIHVILLGVFDCNIYIFFHSDVQGHVFHLLCVLT